MKLAPMEALAALELPEGPAWQYEPKWDGFRCIAFREGGRVELQSKSGQPLGRYFPDIVRALENVRANNFVLDGELVVPVDGHLSFDELQLRLHPAASRVNMLAAKHPALYIVFDLLTGDLPGRPLLERRKKLETFADKYFADAKVGDAKVGDAKVSGPKVSGPKVDGAEVGGAEVGDGAETPRLSPGLNLSPALRLSPATASLRDARQWLRTMGGGLDGIIAKRLDAAYESGERTGAMQKIKDLRTADCVVGGFRYASSGKVVGSLLLGLYGDDGLLHHVGFTSSIATAEKRALTKKLEALREPPGFTGRSPGGPSRWSTERSSEFEPLAPKLVVEVQYDHFTGGRFRHGTKLLRWRLDKAPEQCRMSQVERESRSPLGLITSPGVSKR